MREIKFRAWDGDNIVSLSKALFRDLIAIQCDRADSYSIEINYNGIILMQYTGLKDKNGKEIYEGDIVKFSGTMCDTAICPVEFCEGRFIFRLTDFSWRDIMGWRGTEIIGNIYENPELLET